MMSLDISDLDKIRAIVKESLESTIAFMQNNIERNTNDIAKNNKEIRDLEIEQSVTEVFVKNIYKRFDWKGWIALVSVLVAVIGILKST